MSIGNNRIYLDDVDLLELAEELGTPLYVFSESRLREVTNNLMELSRRYLPNSRIYYALKANSNLSILNILRSMGVGAEVVSCGELYKALLAGYGPEDIIFNGPGKGVEAIEFAIKIGINCVNIDSEYEYDLIEKLAMSYGLKPRVALRIVPEVEAQVIKTGLSWTKFGLEIDRAIELGKKALSSPFIDLVGIHSHLGSQITDLYTWVEAMKKIFGLLNELNSLGISIEHINLGGGLPIDYTLSPIELDIDVPDRFKPMFNEELFFKTMGNMVKEYGLEKMSIFFEFGRRIIADSGILLTRVINIKKRVDGEKWIILDAGFNLLLSSVLYKWYYPLINITKISEPHNHPFRVGGPLCDTDDAFHDIPGEEDNSPQLPKYRPLPKDTGVGDKMMFMHVGAYSFEESSTYNSFPRPPIVLISVDGDIKVIRRGETLFDLVSKEVL